LTVTLRFIWQIPAIAIANPHARATRVNIWTNAFSSCATIIPLNPAQTTKAAKSHISGINFGRKYIWNNMYIAISIATSSRFNMGTHVAKPPIAIKTGIRNAINPAMAKENL
jgi:hypothetical protein